MKNSLQLSGLLVALVLSIVDSHGNTYSVGNTDGGPGSFTLFEAITQANTNPGADVIDLSNVSGRIILTGDLPAISGEVTIRGNQDIVIDGFDKYRILRLNNSIATSFNAEIDGVFFEAGRGTEGFELGIGGGAISCLGNIDLTIRNCLFTSNVGYLGGAIIAQCVGLRLENCTLMENRASVGGAIDVTDTNLIVRNCTFANNTATSGNGGAVSNSGSGNAVFDHCTIVANTTASKGGGLSLLNATSDIRNCVFSKNQATLNTSDINGSGPGVTFSGSNHRQLLDGDPLLGPLDHYRSKVPTYCLLRNSPLRDRIDPLLSTGADARGVVRPQNGLADIGAFEAQVAVVTNTGGGTGTGTLHAALVSNVDYIDMSGVSGTIKPLQRLPSLSGIVLAGPGAARLRITTDREEALFTVANAAPLILQALTLGPNGGTFGRRCILAFSTPVWAIQCHFDSWDCFNAALGGPVLWADDCEVLIDSCTFSNNSTRIDSGGAIQLLGSSAIIVNSTFSNNAVEQSGDGGAIAIHNLSAKLELDHCTFYNNRAAGDGGHLVIGAGIDSASIDNCLFLTSSVGGSGLVYHDPGSKVTTNTNFAQTAAGGIIDTTLISPGDGVPVHALLPLSLPIDLATIVEGSPALDQRGASRHGYGSAPDVGAYEFVDDKYLAWVSTYYRSPLPAAGDDTDGDNFSTLEEFLFLMNPTHSDRELAPKFNIKISPFFSNGGLTFRENAEAACSLNYRVQRSTDLRNWQSAGMNREPFSIIRPGYSEVGYYSDRSIGAAPFATPSEHYRINIERSAARGVMCLVRDPGNNADSNGRGAVAASYRIAQQEVSFEQYLQFLNAVDPLGDNDLELYQTSMDIANVGRINVGLERPAGTRYWLSSGSIGQFPIVGVNYWNAVRYANWLHNGGTRFSDTEDGAYTLLGGTPLPSNAASIVGRNPGSRVFLPNADEWYKAAYYSGTGNYSLYPMGGDTANNLDDPGNANSASYGRGVEFSPTAAYPLSQNRYHTRNMGGNVDEFVEKSAAGDSVLNMGGTCSGDEIQLRSTSWDRVTSTTTARYSVTGFRIATTAE